MRLKICKASYLKVNYKESAEIKWEIKQIRRTFIADHLSTANWSVEGNAMKIKVFICHILDSGFIQGMLDPYF